LACRRNATALHRDAVVLLLPDPNRIELAPAQIESLALGLNSPIHIFYFPLHIESASSFNMGSDALGVVSEEGNRQGLQLLPSISPLLYFTCFFFNFLFLPVMPIDMCSNEFCLTTFYLASFASFGSAQIKCCWLGTVFFLGYISYHYFLPWRVGIELQV